jgi:divalent metal cation (Fe/Co/Zn/Cd) transporter
MWMQLKKFIEGNTVNRSLIVPAVGFAVLLVGLLLNLLGWYVFDSRAVVVVSLIVGAAGLAIGFVGILIGQVLTIKNWFSRAKRD